MKEAAEYPNKSPGKPVVVENSIKHTSIQMVVGWRRNFDFNNNVLAIYMLVGFFTT